MLFADKDRAKKAGTLVCIYLRGGCDALNMVVPFGDPRYYQVRPSIAIAAKDQGQEKGVIALDKFFGLHPSMEALYPLWEKKRFAPVINVGSPHPSRSHFDCQDFMEYAAPGERGITAGWLNRFLSATAEESESDFRAVATQALLPRALRGDFPVLAVPDLDRGRNDPLDVFDEVYQELDAMAMGTREEDTAPANTEDKILRSGRTTIDAIRRYREIVDKASTGESKYPENWFARGLRQIARVIKADAGLEVACLDFGGWDHHIQEGGYEGTMANMLRTLSEGLAAFMADLGDRSERVVCLTMSEFGRTVHENGNRGTDHGHGGVMLAVGGRVNGGKVYGQWAGLEDKNLYEERDLPVWTDFRSIQYEVLSQLFLCQVPKDFFPKYRVNPKDCLGLIRGAT